MNQPGPYQIEHARLMKARELQGYLSKIHKLREEKMSKGLPILEKHRDSLLSEYHNIEQAALQEYKNRHNELLLRKKAFETKTCQYSI